MKRRNATEPGSHSFLLQHYFLLVCWSNLIAFSPHGRICLTLFSLLLYESEIAQPLRSDIMKIGEKIEGKGIYIGQWQPKDRTGKSLGKTFALYAAPEDLTDETGKKLTATFRDTANRMTTLKNWHGHDGGDFTNDATIIQGLAHGSAVGKWFIPTKELLV